MRNIFFNYNKWIVWPRYVSCRKTGFTVLHLFIITSDGRIILFWCLSLTLLHSFILHLEFIYKFQSVFSNIYFLEIGKIVFTNFFLCHKSFKSKRKLSKSSFEPLHICNNSQNYLKKNRVFRKKFGFFLKMFNILGFLPLVSVFLDRNTFGSQRVTWEVKL